jgi:hypothetical protein
MKKTFTKYANSVITFLDCDIKTKQRIKEDIIETLNDRFEELKIENPYELMGDPKSVSNEFAENLHLSKETGINYISSFTIGGFPLVHISSRKNVVAKGILAIGYRSIGIISFGALSAGVVSFGALSIGVFSFGGLAIAISAAFGGLAIAYDIALGGLAIAKSLAMGGLAIAKDVAVGGVTSAQLSAFKQISLSPASFKDKETYAFYLPDRATEFRIIFDRLFENFGALKTQIIHKLFY